MSGAQRAALIGGLVACLVELGVPPHDVTVTDMGVTVSTTILRWYPIGGTPPKIIYLDESALPGSHGVTFPAEERIAAVPLGMELVATASMIALLAVVLGAGREEAEEAGRHRT